MATTTRRPWEPTDVEHLRRLVAARTPMREICTTLGRTMTAVLSRASREKIAVRPVAASPPPRELLTPIQQFVLTRLWTEKRPLRIVHGSAATVPVRLDDGEWGIATRRSAIEALVARGFIQQVGQDRYALTEAGMTAVMRSRPRRAVFKRHG